MRTAIDRINSDIEELTKLIDESRVQRVDLYQQLAESNEDYARKHPEAYEQNIHTDTESRRPTTSVL